MNGRLTGLDFLRGVAAIAVLILHAFYLGKVDIYIPANLAVDFFFLLSGFVLARAYEHRMDAVSFVAARFRRLWPLIALGSTLGALHWLWIGEPPEKVAVHLAWALLLLPYVNLYFTLNTPAWSITFELFANAVHAVFLKRLSPTILALIGFACFCFIAGTRREPEGAFGPEFFLGFPRVLASYCIGVALYRWLGDAPRGHPIIALLGIPAMIGLAALLPPELRALPILLSPLVLLSGLSFQSRIGAFLGALSFPLYAVHWPIMKALIQQGMHWLAATLVAVLFAVGVTAIIATAERVRSKKQALAEAKSEVSL